MTTINFVSKDEANQAQLLRVRRLVVGITTGILVVYLVGVAGLLGWWWYWNGKQKRTSGEVDDLTVMVTQYSEAEITARKLALRAEDVNNFLRSRGEASESASILTGDVAGAVVGWDYASEGQQRVEVSGATPADLQSHALYLQDKYNTVQPQEINWRTDQGWRGSFLVSGRKKT